MPRRTSEKVITEPIIDTGAELMASMQDAVTTLAMMRAAIGFAKLYQHNPKDFRRGLSAFVSLAKSGALDDYAVPAWRIGTNIQEVAEPLAMTRAAESLQRSGANLIRLTSEGEWIDDIVRPWEGRKVTIWRPQESGTHALARYQMRHDYSEQNMAVETGVIISGEVMGIDPTDGGSIGLYKGIYRYFDSSRGPLGTAPSFNPVPMIESPFQHVTVDHIFSLVSASDNGLGSWLPTITLREVDDFSEPIHPEASPVS